MKGNARFLQPVRKARVTGMLLGLAVLGLFLGVVPALAAGTGGYSMKVLTGQKYQSLDPNSKSVTVITGAQKDDSYDMVGNRVAIGFDFKFFGQSYDHLSFSCNGYLQFERNGWDDYRYDGSGLLNPDQPNSLIAPLWGRKLFTFI